MVIPSARKPAKSSSAFFTAIASPVASDFAEITGAAASMSMAMAARELLRRPITASRAANQERSMSKSICRASSASSASARTRSVGPRRHDHDRNNGLAALAITTALTLRTLFHLATANRRPHWLHHRATRARTHRARSFDDVPSEQDVGSASASPGRSWSAPSPRRQDWS